MKRYEHYEKDMQTGPEAAPQPKQNRVPIVDLELSKPPPGWVNRALCAEYARRTGDWDIMFPVGTTGKDGRAFGPRYRRQKALCDRCPVKAECLDYGFNEPFGMWGGLGPRERRQLGGGRGKLTRDGQIMTPPKGNKPEQEN